MSILAELLAIAIVWLSSLSLCQFGVTLDRHPRVEAVRQRTVVRTPPPTLEKLVDCPRQAARLSQV
ncbi:MAG: hypothetical protein JWP92_1148 [Caulobacter sp.]|nr:hypothetical protein [Caulobacter sp.]